MNEKIDRILDELSNIRVLLEFSVKSKLEEEIIEIASTKERRKIWTLLEGKLSTEDLANQCQVTRRAVQIFIKELSDRKLVSYEKKGYPKRKFEVMPSYWRL